MNTATPTTQAASGDELSLSFAEAVRARRSIRAFLPEPIPPHILRDILEDAQHAPSNCNTQPWNTHIVSGEARDRLSQALHAANDQGAVSPDFFWDERAFNGRLDERRREQGAIYYKSLGVTRDDPGSRARAGARNFSFFGAPHVALLFMPVIGDNVRIAGDIGMYAENFLLSLTARGFGGVPQTVLGLFAQTIRDTLGIDDDQKMLFGISFGRPEYDALANSTRIGRDPFAANVTFHN